MEMDCQFISIYGKFVTSQTASFSVRIKYWYLVWLYGVMIGTVITEYLIWSNANTICSKWKLLVSQFYKSIHSNYHLDRGRSVNQWTQLHLVQWSLLPSSLIRLAPLMNLTTKLLMHLNIRKIRELAFQVVSVPVKMEQFITYILNILLKRR